MKQRTRTGALRWLLCLALVLGLMAGMSLTAYADLEPVAYMAWDETENQLVLKNGDDACKDYTVVTKGTTFENGKWYVVNGETDIGSIDAGFGKSINLILCDGYNATASDIMLMQGSITIYAGSTGETVSGSGKLTVNTPSGNAVSAMEGTMRVNGGVLELSSKYTVFNDGGSITVNGGSLTAYSTDNKVFTDQATVSLASGMIVMAGSDETSAADVTDTFATTHNQKWVRITGAGQSEPEPEPASDLETPLTLEAITDGTIGINNPKSGMQYSLNGGAKTPCER